MAEYYYAGKLIQVTVNGDESFIEKLNRMSDLGIATDCNYTRSEVKNINLFTFYKDKKTHYVYEELIEHENGVNSILYISESEISTFEDMILRSKECLELFETT